MKTILIFKSKIYFWFCQLDAPFDEICQKLDANVLELLMGVTLYSYTS